MAVVDMPDVVLSDVMLPDVMPPDDALVIRPDVSEQVGRKPLRSVAFGVSSNSVVVLPAGTPNALVPRPAVPSAVLADDEVGVEIIELPGEELALAASVELDDEELALVAAVKLDGEDAKPDAEVLDCATPQAPEASLVPAVVRIDIEEVSSGAPEAPDEDVIVVGELDGIIIPPPSKVGIAAIFEGPLLQGTGLPVLSPYALAPVGLPAVKPAPRGDVAAMLAGAVDPPCCARLGPPPSAVTAIIDTTQRNDLMTIRHSSWVFLRPRCDITMYCAITINHGSPKAEALIFKKCESRVEKSTPGSRLPSTSRTRPELRHLRDQSPAPNRSIRRFFRPGTVGRRDTPV
jgi:hypothetical protein